MTYCSKSWTDININFQYRTLRHCCKSNFYNFPKELTVDFFNNSQNITDRRTQSLSGIQHDDCNFCWKNLHQKKPSYRDFMNTWDDEFIKNNKIDDSYVNCIEVNFDNICDMGCLYCDATSSSKIASEEKIKIKQHSSIRDYEIFTEWLKLYFERDDLSSNEFSIVVLGGEPTMSKMFYTFVNFIENLANKHTKYIFTLGFITNANSNIKVFDKISNMISNSNMKWNVIISNESIENDSTLIRHGLVWENFNRNIINYFQHSKINHVVLLPTINALTVKNFSKYIEYINKIAILHSVEKKIFWNGNYIQHPKQLDIANLPDNYRKYINEAREVFENYCSYDIFVGTSRFLKFLDFIENRISTNYDENFILTIEEFLTKKAAIKNDTDIISLIDQFR